MTDYEKLKQIIQAANPEIMELKFGCEVLMNQYLKCEYDTLYENEIVKVGSDLWINCSLYYKQHTFQSLGRPIRLADVLLAIQKKPGINNVAIEEYGVWMQTDYEGYGEIHDGDKRVKWNFLDDNLDHQSDECKLFLIELLAK